MRFTHVPGTLYRIMDGVRRAKAAHMSRRTHIQAEVIDPGGVSLGEADVPINALRSPKAQIRRITPADESRWDRALRGAQQAALPYPSITIQPIGSEQGIKLEDVDFDFGGQP
jgi:hypothetical protein